MVLYGDLVMRSIRKSAARLTDGFAAYDLLCEEPIATLEEYGLEIEAVTFLERACGVTLEGLFALSPEQVRRLDGIGESRARALAVALDALVASVVGCDRSGEVYA